MLRICVFLLTFFSIFIASVKAQDLTQRQQEIMKVTLSVDGYLTDKLHAEFWEILRGDSKYYPGVEQEISTLLGPLILDGLDFQKETWASIERSYEERTVIKTDGFFLARDKLERNPDPVLRAAIIPSLRKADRIIQAAAERTSYTSGDMSLFISPELVEKMKTGLDASFFRMQLLANPKWENKPKEWQLKEARLRVISALPFTYEQQDLTIANGVSAKTSSYSLNIDGQNFIGLASIKLAAKVDDSGATLTRIAHSSLAALGISSPLVIAMKFRGEASAVATGQTQTASGPVYGSVRALRPSSRGDIVLFFAISGTSQIDADDSRESLEISTVID